MRMNLYRKQAFSLTELLIVLVIVAVLFAALAPIFAKRQLGSSNASESVWNYVSYDNEQKDVYFDPGHPKWSSIAFIGVNPDMSDLQKTSPKAKVVINAKDKQNMIQFRYGLASGVNVGTLFMDNKQNILLSQSNNDFVDAGSAEGVTVAGNGAFQRITAKNVVAFGVNSLRGTSDKNSPLYKTANNFDNNANLVAVGFNTGKDLPSNAGANMIILGSNAGQVQRPINNTIAVGALSLSSPHYNGLENVYLGYNTGNGIADPGISLKKQGNVIVGSTFFGQLPLANFGYPANNVILGNGTYDLGYPAAKNLTAVGYEACKSIASDTGIKTCIGYSSGRGGGTPKEFRSDKHERIFLGGAPRQTGSVGFAGRSVLEVHNVPGDYAPNYDRDGRAYVRDPKFPNHSVVLNSNLAVRGNYFQTYDPNEGLTDIVYREISQAAGPGNRTCIHDKWKRFRRHYRCKALWRGHERPRREVSRSLMTIQGVKCNYNKNTYPTSGCLNLKTSDIRLKENIVPNNDGLDKILALKPYYFTFKADKTKQVQVGVIAQDLMKVFPDSVTKHEDGFLRIRWDEMFYAAINAIKTLDVKIEKLAFDITNMEKDVKNIKAKHVDIHKNIVLLNSRVTKLEK